MKVKYQLLNLKFKMCDKVGFIRSYVNFTTFQAFIKKNFVLVNRNKIRIVKNVSLVFNNLRYIWLINTFQTYLLNII